CETISILKTIKKTLDKHNIAPARLRADFHGTKPHQITTFRELHGDSGPMPNEVEQDAQRLYLSGEPGTREPVWTLLEAFIEGNWLECLAEIGRVAGEERQTND